MAKYGTSNLIIILSRQQRSNNAQHWNFYIKQNLVKLLTDYD